MDYEGAPSVSTHRGEVEAMETERDTLTCSVGQIDWFNTNTPAQMLWGSLSALCLDWVENDDTTMWILLVQPCYSKLAPAILKVDYRRDMQTTKLVVGAMLSSSLKGPVK